MAELSDNIQFPKPFNLDDYKTITLFFKGYMYTVRNNYFFVCFSFSNVKGLHLNFCPITVHPKYPISTLLLGMIMPSWLEPDPHERRKAFEWRPIKSLEESGYLHIQGNSFSPFFIFFT